MPLHLWLGRWNLLWSSEQTQFVWWKSFRQKRKWKDWSSRYYWGESLMPTKFAFKSRRLRVGGLICNWNNVSEVHKGNMCHKPNMQIASVTKRWWGYRRNQLVVLLMNRNAEDFKWGYKIMRNKSKKYIIPWNMKLNMNIKTELKKILGRS